LYYIRHQELICRMHPQLGDQPNVEEFAKHIADFSLAGIRGNLAPRRRGQVRQQVRRRAAMAR
jgi:hypothetical protein